ncbi:MAG: glycoside hydrolase family 31 protein [Desulfurococcaceae archaeon]
MAYKYSFSMENNVLIATGSGETLRIEPWCRDVIRFRSSYSGRISMDDWTLLKPCDKPDVEVNINGDKALLRNGKLVLEITRDGVARYITVDGKVLLEELWIDYRVNNANLLKARNYRHINGDLYKIQLYLKARDNEHVYGMGQYAIGYLDLKGCSLELAHRNTQVSIPFALFARPSEGVFYGFLWNNPCIGRVEFAKNWTMWECEASKQIDYLVIYGETPAEVIKKYLEITGKPPLLPEYAFGFWQSKLRYRSQGELLNVAREYRKRGLPLSIIVIDFFHWTNQGDWKFDPRFWPDPDSMVKELEEMGVKLMVSIWPTVDLNSENYGEMVNKGFLVKTEKGIPILHSFRGLTTYVDFTNPDAGKFVWSRVRENYYKHGIKLFWLDEAEPEFGWDYGYFNILPYHYENVRYHMGNALEIGNIYPFYYAKAFAEGLMSEGERDFVLLIRAAWIGSQRFPIVMWSGDIPSTFDSLRRQIKAGLNTSLAGIVYWTTDIGGFYGGDPEDPSFRELIIRWFQFGVFCPIFRLHGYRKPYPENASTCDVYELTGGPNEIWSFGEEAYRVIRGLLFLREMLKPYILEQAKRASEEGIPIMRPLFYDFPQDLEAYKVEDEYMFGPDILVAPVYEKGAVYRKVYLPKGATWIDVNSGDTYNGGIYLDYKVNIETIPVFTRRQEIYEIFKKWREIYMGS